MITDSNMKTLKTATAKVLDITQPLIKLRTIPNMVTESFCTGHQVNNNPYIYILNIYRLGCLMQMSSILPSIYKEFVEYHEVSWIQAIALWTGLGFKEKACSN